MLGNVSSEIGDVKKPVMIKTIKNGQFVPWGMAEAAALQDPREIPDDLARVMAAWSTLPEPVRAGIVAMVEAANASTEAKP